MDRDGLIRYVAEHEKALTRLCLKLCQNLVDAEDLYQETWCRVVSKIHLYDESLPFLPWLFAICVNTYRNAHKKAKRRPVAQFDNIEEMEWAIDRAVSSEPVFNVEHDLIRQIVHGLDEKFRIVIVLHYFSDFSVQELASIIGIPQGTVKSRLHKARKTIKGRLEEHEEKHIR